MRAPARRTHTRIKFFFNKSALYRLLLLKSDILALRVVEYSLRHCEEQHRCDVLVLPKAHFAALDSHGHFVPSEWQSVGHPHPIFISPYVIARSNIVATCWSCQRRISLRWIPTVTSFPRNDSWWDTHTWFPFLLTSLRGATSLRRGNLGVSRTTLSSNQPIADWAIQ